MTGVAEASRRAIRWGAGVGWLWSMGCTAPPAPSSMTAGGITIEEAWIPMPDGVRLSVDLWRPAGADTVSRRPVLLEYLPYRKNEARGRRMSLYGYFVRRGYVVARVDIRGTGASEGTLIPHEYSEIEQRDGDVVLDWLARQPFSTGKVGMFGISWGGFNAIQMAMRRPPALGAIIAVDATDDLYQDDVHFIDGMMHVDSWEMSQDLANAMPGAPDYRIDDRYFAERFDQPPWMLTYKAQQRDGPFWDRASLKTRYDAIAVPTFLIGGWYDGYRDAIPRMLERMTVPMKAIVGAWNHTFPDSPYPEPGIEWRHEAVRWFDHWLKDIDTGIMREPKLAVYVRQWHPPGPYLAHAPGFWRGEPGWPIARSRDSVLYPAPAGRLGPRPAAAEAIEQLRYHPTSGVEAGGPVMWYGDVAPDQRPTDAFSLVYQTEPLDRDLEILGLPKATLVVSTTAPLAHWFVRLSDVAPDGTTTLITGAGQNGAHRNSARDPAPIEPGRPFPLDVEMHFTSWVIPKGHRLRLAVGNAQWPMIWPTPDTMTTTLRLGPRATRLVLPVIPEGGGLPIRFQSIDQGTDTLAGFGSISLGTTSGYGEISSVERNPATGQATVTATSRSAERFPWGQEHSRESIVHQSSESRPDSTTVRGEYATTVTLPDRTLRWEVEVTVRSDRAAFHYRHVRRLFVNDALRREKSWVHRFPRDHQ